MPDLRRTAGFPLQTDDTNLMFSDSVSVQRVVSVNLEDMKPELLNRSLSCPCLFYKRYIGVDRDGLAKKAGLRFDLMMVPPNLAGIEYVKTKGHFSGFVTAKSRYTAPQILDVIYGCAMVILQRPKSVRGENGVELDGTSSFLELQDVVIVRVQKGRKLVIPPGFGYVVVNTKQSTLIFALLHKAELTRPRGFGRQRGGSYYIIRKNARQEIVMNPHYREIPDFVRKGDSATVSMLGIRSNFPLFRQVESSPEKFDWMKFPSRVDWSPVLERLCGR